MLPAENFFGSSTAVDIGMIEEIHTNFLCRIEEFPVKTQCCLNKETRTEHNWRYVGSTSDTPGSPK